MQPSDSSIAEPPGRPREIEELTNLRLVHPLSHALVARLMTTPISPNQISMASVVMAACAAGCYLVLAWPWNAPAGLLFQFAWHVLDGADGDLARRTGRASPIGELVDGVCDHVSQALIYLALTLVLQRQIGTFAWLLAGLAAASHFVQANAYESGRKTYRRWVYGARWMRQDLGELQARRGAAGVLARLYVGLSRLTDSGEGDIEKAMEGALSAGAESADAARRLYRHVLAPQVRTSFCLGGNARTMAIFLSMMAGSPAWYFLFEVTVLNAALAWLLLIRRRRNRDLVAALGELG